MSGDPGAEQSVTPSSDAPARRMAYNWLVANFLTILTSVILSGTVGFFVAIESVKGEISDLRDRISKVETQVGTGVLPKFATIDEHTKTMTLFEGRLTQIERQTDLSIQTNKLLDLRMEAEKDSLTKDLNTLLTNILHSTQTSDRSKK